MSGTNNEYKELSVEFLTWIIETAGIIKKETLKLNDDTINIKRRVDVITGSGDADFLHD